VFEKLQVFETFRKRHVRRQQFQQQSANTQHVQQKAAQLSRMLDNLQAARVPQRCY
jgi:arginine repressor